MTQKYDAVIVGARVAGAATAMLLARRGAKVLVVDHAQPGDDTMSTHALMRTAVYQLAKWGALPAIRAAGTPAIRRTTFLYGSEVVPIDIRPELGVDALYAPRRPVLDGALQGAAWTAGAEMRFGTGCTGLTFGGDGRVTGVTLTTPEGASETVRADLVIGADGRRSAVARHVRAPITRRAANTVACVYAYASGLSPDGFRWHHDVGAAGGLIPTNDGLACTFIALTPDKMAALRKEGPLDPVALAHRFMPAFAAELAGARLETRPVIFSGEPGYFRASAGPGWALVGDAGYFRDPITAHGISDALRDAELLADAVNAGSLSAYPARRDALSAAFFEHTERIAALGWSLDELKVAHVALNKAMRENLRQIAMADGALPMAA